MSMVTAVGGMILQFFVNDLGASAVAAYAASTKIRSVIGEFSNALGMTFMTFVGQNYGAQKYDRIKDGVRMGVILSILIHIPLSAIEIFGGKRIASLMVTDPSVLELCRQYLLIVGIFVFFLGFLMVFRNCIQGMGNTWIPYFQRTSSSSLSCPQLDRLKGGFAIMKSARRLAWRSLKNVSA